jgi:hypothetical protein
MATKDISKMNKNDLTLYFSTFIKNLSLDDEKHNEWSKTMDRLEVKDFEKKTETDFLYPHLLDKNFNQKIASKKEFNDSQYDPEIYDVKEHSKKMCNSKEFTLLPHQTFIGNFLSFQTPYNNLLLYHGLGTGKTCSAITVCEEMRDYLKQVGIGKRIIIVASPNVQENFKLQLFDPRNLKKINGLWSIKSCSGNKFIDEVNPMKMKGFTREKIIRQIRKIINLSYLFLGYEQFSNYISRKLNKYPDNKRRRNREIKREFSDRLIVIDEVHNIRSTEDSPHKQVAKNLLKMVVNTTNLKLLLLSATPMYNSYKEIIWLINLMNLNDGRFSIKVGDVFDREGNFIIGDDGSEVGKDLLIQKATGYISFIRGGNPYSFPYRIWPSLFNEEKSIKNIIKYPSKQLNDIDIPIGIEHLDIYIEKIGTWQEKVYNSVIDNMKSNFDEKGITMGLGYQTLEGPLQSLNMSFPSDNMDDYKNLYGKRGLDRMMNYDDQTKKNFSYKPAIVKKYGKIFSPDEIPKYSCKIASICNTIQKSDGIVIIYSQYINGGCIPIALALEELGFERYGGKKLSLFKKAPSPEKNGKYIMITGDIKLSPNNAKELNAITSENNTRGEKVKVAIVSKAGAEGLDFKNIRQVHILDPWYNMNRIEQVIGRGVRTCSHKLLPFEERNCEIYLYGTILSNDVEAADLYTYRLAENKSIRIGVVSRILKENAVDCILNKGQRNMTEGKMNQETQLILPSKKKIDYKIGDKSYSSVCDYMETCDYVCKPLNEIGEINYDTYSETFMVMNLDKIISRIKMLMKEFYVFKKKALVKGVNMIKKYPKEQIDMALDKLITDKQEIITDNLGRVGHLINIGEYYLFHPIELEKEDITMYERTNPIPYKREKLSFSISKRKAREDLKGTKIDLLLRQIKNEYSICKKDNTIKKGLWFERCGRIIHELKKTINEDKLHTYALHHILDVLSYNNKVTLINFLYSNDNLDEVEKEMKVFFEMFKVGGIMLLLKKKSIEKLKLDKNEWRQLTAVEKAEKDGEDLIMKRKMKDSSKMGGIVGIIDYLKEKLVFKIKKYGKQKGVKIGKAGLVCNQISKRRVIENLNEIYKKDKYSIENTKISSSNGRGKKTNELCIEQELILRYYSDILKDGKIWFLSSVDSLLNKKI